MTITFNVAPWVVYCMFGFLVVNAGLSMANYLLQRRIKTSKDAVVYYRGRKDALVEMSHHLRNHNHKNFVGIQQD